MSSAEPKQVHDVVPGESQGEPWGPLADLGCLSPETFDPYVGDIFQVANPRWETPLTHVNPLYVAPLDDAGEPLPQEHEWVELELIEVSRFPRLRSSEGGFEDRPREPFALLFKGCAEPALMNASLSIHHSQLGVGHCLFNQVQVSLKVPKDGQRHRWYEVVFG